MDRANISGSGSAATTLFFGNNPATISTSSKTEWFGTLRGRLGFVATPDLLVYGTGGFAYGSVKHSASIAIPAGVSNSQGNFGTGYACGGVYGNSTCFIGSGTHTATGWTVGGGSEFRLNRSMTVKLEYLYVDLGTNSFSIVAAHPGALAPSMLAGSGDTTFSIVRAGVNVRF